MRHRACPWLSPVAQVAASGDLLQDLQSAVQTVLPRHPELKIPFQLPPGLLDRAVREAPAAPGSSHAVVAVCVRAQVGAVATGKALGLAAQRAVQLSVEDYFATPLVEIERSTFEPPSARRTKSEQRRAPAEVGEAPAGEHPAAGALRVV